MGEDYPASPADHVPERIIQHRGKLLKNTSNLVLLEEGKWIASQELVRLEDNKPGCSAVYHIHNFLVCLPELLLNT